MYNRYCWYNYYSLNNHIHNIYILIFSYLFSWSSSLAILTILSFFPLIYLNFFFFYSHTHTLTRTKSYSFNINIVIFNVICEKNYTLIRRYCLFVFKSYRKCLFFIFMYKIFKEIYIYFFYICCSKLAVLYP